MVPIQVLRVHAPFWMGTPHCSDEDFVYNGYYIPKNTTMVLNVYALHHDEDRYPESYVPTSSRQTLSDGPRYSSTFNPDRYLGDELSSSESAKQSNVLLRDHWAFGAGYVVSR